MSIFNIREHKHFIILRNAFLLSLFALCESIQLMLGAVWFFKGRPLSNTPGVLPEGLPFVSPERETMLFHIVIVTAALVFIGAVWLFRDILKTDEFIKRCGLFFAVEGLLTVFLLSAGFKLLLYSYRPQLASEAFGILLILALLNKLFGWKFKELWQEMRRLFFHERNLPLFRQLAHVAAIALIFLAIYVPNPVAAVARIFIGEQFHHYDLGLVGSGWAFQSGCRLNVDSLSQYGVGMPILMSILAKWIGGFTHVNVLIVLVWTVIIYYVLYYLLLRAWLKDKLLIILFGILTALRLQVFHSGVMPFVMTYPMTTPFRWWYDIIFFWMMFLYLARQPRKIYIFIAAAACGAANFHMIDTGVYLTATFYFYLLLSLIIPHVRSSLYPRKQDYGWLAAFFLTVPAVMLFLFWLVEGNEIFKLPLWQHTFEFAYYFINGLGLEPVSVNIKQGYLFSTALGLFFPCLYLLTVLFVVGLFFFRKLKLENLFVVLWAVYGLATYQYYIVHTTESCYYVYVLPFVSVVCFWFKKWSDHVSPEFYRKVGVTLVLVSIFALFTNHTFLSYPNLLSLSHNPIIDPRVYQTPAGRASYFHHLYREFPDNFKLPKNSLGETDEKLVSEADFISDDQLAAYYKAEYDFSIDAKLIQKFIPPGTKVALLSSFETAFLMQANRPPLFKYFPNLNSRPLRMRIFPVSSIPSQEHLNYTLKQLAEAPPYVFMERIFLSRPVPPAYYHDSPELMKIIDYILDHYEPVEAGKFLVAMKLKG